MLAKYEREEKQNLKKIKIMFRGSDSIQSNYAEFRRPKDEIQIQPVKFPFAKLNFTVNYRYPRNSDHVFDLQTSQ